MKKKLLPDALVAERYGVSFMTIWRWDRSPDLGFPRPIRIKNRKYRVEAELDEFPASDRPDRGGRVIHYDLHNIEGRCR